MAEEKKTVFYPINMQALCVVNDDAQKFVPKEQNFKALDDRKVAPLGEKLIQSAFAEPSYLTKGSGIHLHWALPDSISHIYHTEDTENNTIQKVIPNVPNRWLITRISNATNPSGDLQSKSWIVESDYLYYPNPSLDNKGDQLTDIPFGIDNSQQFQKSKPYRYLGRKMEYEKWNSSSQPKDKDGYIGELDTLGFGQLHFAAFYPNCKSVFGFHDDDPPSGRVTYNVIGWYQDPKEDIFHIRNDKSASKELRDIYKRALNPLLEKLKERHTNNQQIIDTEVINFSIYHGFVNNILWDADNKESIEKYYSNKSVIEGAELGVGNTAKEAFTTLEKSKIDGLEAKNCELMLNLIQHDLLNDVTSKDIDKLVADHMLDLRFHYKDGGVEYVLDPNLNISDSAKIDLLQQIETLNKIEDQSEKLTRLTETIKKQVYLDWHKLILADYDQISSRTLSKKASEKITVSEFNDIVLKCPDSKIRNLKDLYELFKEHIIDKNALNNKLQNDISFLTKKLKPSQNITANEALIKQLLENEKIVAASKSLFYEPVNPTILMYHSNLTTWKFAGKRNDPEGDILLLRNEDELIENSGSIVLAQSDLWNEEHCAWDNIGRLLEEAVYYVRNPKVENQDFTAPEALSRNVWERNPWIPLLLDWEIEFVPKEEGRDKNFTADFFNKQFSLEEGASELSYTDLNFDKPHQIRGRTILGELTSFDIEEKLSKYKNTDLKDTVFKSGKMCLTQQFEGLTDAFLMMRKTPELRIIDNKNPATADLVSSFIGADHYQSSDASLAFCPIRNGIFRISRLHIVDCFGQRKVVLDKGLDSNSANFSTSLKLEDSIKKDIKLADTKTDLKLFGGLLPPRITQPSRFNFDFISESQDQNPIAGWIVPNHLQNTLFLFDSSGESLGYLGKDPNSNKVALFNDIAPKPTYRLKKEIKQIVDFFTDSKKDVSILNSFIELQTTALKNKKFNGSHSGYQISYLLGRPIAICKIALSFELMNLPAADQSWRALVLNTFINQNIKPVNEIKMGLDHNFSQVEIPVVLGNSKDENDGLLGFFDSFQYKGQLRSPYNIEGEKAFVKDTLLHIASSYFGGAGIQDKKVVRDFLVLLDPELFIQGSTGLLPKIKIQLPQKNVKSTLDKLKYTFSIHPVLMEKESSQMPVPDYENMEWSWLHKEYPDKDTIQSSNIAPPTERISDKLWIQEGWLKLEKKRGIQKYQDGKYLKNET